MHIAHQLIDISEFSIIILSLSLMYFKILAIEQKIASILIQNWFLAWTADVQNTCTKTQNHYVKFITGHKKLATSIILKMVHNLNRIGIICIARKYLNKVKISILSWTTVVMNHSSVS